MFLAERWEHGSEFHWLSYLPNASSAVVPWSKNGQFCGSGRDAFRILILHGLAARGWKRLWVPSYFCQEVVASLLSTGVEVRTFSDGPVDAAPDFDKIGFEPGDVLLRINFFGLRSVRSTSEPDRKCVEVIEDHTHDPWSDWTFASNADWCMASLRKTLPIPDGGVLWSPAGHPVPPAMPVTPERYDASLEKLVAMVLKRLYLEGHLIEKDTFRRLAISGESHIASGQVSGMPAWTMNLLRTFPVETWRELRGRNHRILSAGLVGVTWVTVLQPQDSLGVCPFSGILVFDSPGRCEFVRQRLIASGVYPAVLWPLDKPVVSGIPKEHVDFSHRMLSIHCDMRYNESDMEHVAALVRKFGGLVG